ncbi:hypothetical protein HL653_10560 [Sphingomonas sp. AP4-R1]|uniref:hypothetical protein n=1 Tax=Sphingomonas sp. AP4-R1 TaxID=2735134 RepID=UPI001493A55B|nr:hypothetical protein [Sphingomonas sp. AP4-R1]QJU58179.1 hypothetical protein HL653_10560 [Sphingomonas sp. AP4-R1]
MKDVIIVKIFAYQARASVARLARARPTGIFVSRASLRKDTLIGNTLFAVEFAPSVWAPSQERVAKQRALSLLLAHKNPWKSVKGYLLIQRTFEFFHGQKRSRNANAPPRVALQQNATAVTSPIRGNYAVKNDAVIALSQGA